MKNLPISEQLRMAIIAAVALLLIELVPALAPLQDAVIAIVSLAVAYIFGKSVENGLARRDGSVTVLGVEEVRESE